MNERFEEIRTGLIDTDCFTELGKELFVEVHDDFPELLNFYQEHMGNFVFSDKEFIENMQSIKRFMQRHPEYFIVNCSNENEFIPDENDYIDWALADIDDNIFENMQMQYNC